MTVLEDISKLTEQTVGGLVVESVTDSGDNGYNLLVYGETGVGKTVLAGSASVVPEMSPVLHLDIEGGTLSLRRRYPEVKRIRIKEFSVLQGVYDDLYVNNPYRTIIVDSLSELQRFSMDKIMADVVAEGKRADQDPDTPAQRDWGKNQNQIRFFVRAFRDLPCNVIFTAHAQTTQEKRTGMWKTKPSLPGKLANEIAGFLDEVYFMYIKRVKLPGSDEFRDERLLLTRATEDTVAKTRLDTLPIVVTNPTMAEIQSATLEPTPTKDTAQ